MPCSPLHGNQTIPDIHSAIAYEYTDSAERLAATGFIDADRNKLARDLDTDRIYILLDPSGPTWQLLGSGGGGGGSGNVSGPEITTDNSIVRWDGTDGYFIQDSGIIIDDLDNITGVLTINGVTIESHASRHENGGSDEISVTGLSGLLADPQTPLAHASTHESGGSDEIDGYNTALVYSPSNYNTPINDIIGEHLAAIDLALASSGGGVTDHGVLTGLTDDDHPQYLLTDGTRALTGNLDLGTNNIINIGTVDGRDVSADGTALDSHIADTANPHGTDIGNLGSGTLAELNAIVTDGTLDDASDPRTPTTHASTHETGGSDAIDGYNIDLVYVPTYYNAPINDLIGEHLARIDETLGTFGSGTGDVVGPASSTDDALVRWNGTTGELVQNSNAILTDTGALTLTLGLTTGADINVGGNSITNVNLVDGVDVSTHATRHENGGADEISVTGLSGLLADPQTPTTHASTHETGGSDAIDGYNVDLIYTPSNYNAPVNDLIGEHIAAIDDVLSPKTEHVEFVLSEDVNNTTQYFFTWRSTGTDSSNGKRSSSGSGMANPNSCSPYQVPFDATITGAVLTVRGVGVQNGSVSYPVTYQANLLDVGFTGNTTLSTLGFSISSSFTVGVWTVGNTDYKGITSLSVDVDAGDMLGLQFLNGTGASLAGQTRMAFITLILEAR